jgi:hypothetical protein
MFSFFTTTTATILVFTLQATEPKKALMTVHKKSENKQFSQEWREKKTTNHTLWIFSPPSQYCPKSI